MMNKSRLESRSLSLRNSQLKRKWNSCSAVNVSDEKSQPSTNSCNISSDLPLFEVNSVGKARRASYRYWPLIIPSAESMAAAGWFYCNIQDRVLCIYCDTICHHWRSSDDPVEVHRRFAPNCIFLRSMIIEENSSPSNKMNKAEPSAQASHPSMRSINCRQTTFQTESWTLKSPSVESFVQAGFFYSGIENIVTCFFCSGSLQKWGPNDEPMIEHARWFPHCIYARHHCGDRLHARIQLKHRQYLKESSLDQQQLNRLVAARLDLPTVQNLRQKYSLTIIKRCLEDRLRLGNDDFENETDLYMACYLVQKQIDIIQGKSDMILIPSLTDTADRTTRPVPRPSLKLDDCSICLTQERQLAFLPCGHLCACTPCAYSVEICPICRQNIESYVRIYSS